jgi:hypothetical protein
MDDLDEGMRIFFVCADAKDETNGFIECPIDLLKIPAFEIVRKLGIALKDEGMFKFREHVLFP